MNNQSIKARFGAVGIVLSMSAGISVSANSFAAAVTQVNAPKNTRTLMERSVRLERKIQQRQRTAEKGQKAESKQYIQGYEDGYNKAVLDLVKAKLLGKVPQGQGINSINGGSVAGAAVGNANGSGNTPQAEEKVSLIDQSVADLMRSQWDAAIEAANASVAGDPGLIAPYINRAWAYAEKGMTKFAIADANQAMSINPNNPLAWNNRAYAHELAGNIVEARADYQQACILDYAPACDTSLKIGGLAAAEIASSVTQLLTENTQKFNQRDWPAVKKLMTRVLQLDPSNPVAYTNRAVALSELGKLPRALEDSNQAIDIKPGFGVAYNNRAYVFELMGNRAKAAEDYSVACKLGITQSCSDYQRLVETAAVLK